MFYFSQQLWTNSFVSILLFFVINLVNIHIFIPTKHNSIDLIWVKENRNATVECGPMIENSWNVITFLYEKLLEIIFFVRFSTWFTVAFLFSCNEFLSLIGWQTNKQYTIFGWNIFGLYSKRFKVKSFMHYLFYARK